MHRFAGHPSPVAACACSPDGRRVLAGSGDGVLCEWDRDGETVLARFLGHGGAITACTYSVDGRYAVSASEDNSLRIWDCASGRCVDVAFGEAWFFSVDAAPGTLAAGDALGNVWVFDCDWLS
jgi:WD40 repeat protein